MRALGLLCVLLALAAAAAGEPFRALDLAGAGAAAQREGRLVVVEFTAAGCTACAELARTTWSDPAVAEWLAGEAVAIRIDGEADPALVRRYAVDAYPTVLFLAADGTIRDRLVGWRSADAFLAEAGAIAAGRDAVARASEVVARDGANPRARLLLGNALAQVGRDGEALAAYRAAIEHGHGGGGNGGACDRLGSLLPAVARLASRHPPAVAAMRAWREAALRRLIAGDGDALADAGELIAIDAALNDPDATLVAFDAIAGLPPPGRPAAAAALVSGALDQLTAARRYRDVVAHQEGIPALIADQLGRLRRSGGPGAATGAPDDLRCALLRAACFYEALVGAGRTAEAAAAGGHILAADASASQVARLIDHAVRAGDPAAAAAIGARGLELVQGGERLLVRRALARLGRE